MIRLIGLTEDFFPGVYADFLAGDDPNITEAQWRKLFFYGWKQPGETYGQVLLDGNTLAGVIGTVFSQRLIQERWMRFCNLHSWYVKKPYRGRSLMMMRSVTRLQNCVITDYTPTKAVVQISQRLGFQQLDNTLKILLPLQAHGKNNALEIMELDDPVTAGAVLSESDFAIYNHHLPYCCTHMHFRDKHSDCYILFSRVERTAIPYGYLRYISNPDFFQRNQSLLRQAIRQRCSVRLLAVDARRFAHMHLPLSFDIPMQANALFRSNEISPDQIDNLYSDVALLNLTTIPGLRSHLKGAFNRLRNPLTNVLR